MIGLLVPLLVLLAVVLGVVAVMQRVMGKTPPQPGEGADVIPYLLMALAIGVAGFSLAELAATAFPGTRFVFDPASELATSLAALIVSVPFAVFFWRRQAKRRAVYPATLGWALYLSMMELTFLTAFVVSTAQFLDASFTSLGLQTWTGTVVFGGIVVFHEVASRRTPSLSDAGELPRVLGSAIGWVTAVIGLGGTLGSGLFTLIYGTTGERPVSPEWHPWVSIALVGVAVWAYKWARPWPDDIGVPRRFWATLVSIVSLTAALGWATAIGVLIIQYLVGDTRPTGQQFESLPEFAAIALVGLGSWAWHRHVLGKIRTNTLRAYEYSMSGVGLISSVSLAIALTVVVLQGDLIVGGEPENVMSIAFALVIALLVWRYFDGRWRKGEPEFEATAWPRRIHNLGLGILFGLVAAGSLITSIFILLRRVLDDTGDGSLLTPAATLIFTGLATWYLLAAYVRDRAYTEQEEVIAPFEVTIVTSHPGPLATRFPKQAKLTVIHRGDDAGVIDGDMADAIVAEVGNRPSLVWVDQDGFRVAPKQVI